MKRTNDSELHNKIKAEFSIPLTKLKEIEREYNPKDDNLHFSRIENPDRKLFELLLEISKEGINIVRRYRNSFLKYGLWFADIFWYDLFLLISASSINLKKNLELQRSLQDNIKELVVILVNISEYSTSVNGDMFKRNQEALGNLIIACYCKDLIELALNKSSELNDKVKEFVEWTVDRVESINQKNA